MIRIAYDESKILTVEEVTLGSEGITYLPAGVRILYCPAIQAAEMLADQGIDILPLYKGGHISKPGHTPYVSVNISPLTSDLTVSRVCIVRRIPIRFDMVNFKVVCEVQHYRDGQHLGEENTEIEEADVINDKWHVFTTTNDILVPSPDGDDVGEFDFYFQVLDSIPFKELMKSSILEMDSLGRFDQ